MIMANSSAIYHLLSKARGIIVKYYSLVSSLSFTNANLLIYRDKFARRGSHAARARGEYIIHSRVAALSQNTSIIFHDLEIQFDSQTEACQRISLFHFLFFQKRTMSLS